MSSHKSTKKDAAKGWFERAGVQGLVVLRLVQTDVDKVYSSAMWVSGYYGNAWDYWGYGWGTAYQPGYITNDTYVTIETNVYSVKDDKLLWASRSESANPETVTKLIDKVIDTNIKEMKKRKIL